jgi:hypothetical protein
MNKLANHVSEACYDWSNLIGILEQFLSLDTALGFISPWSALHPLTMCYRPSDKIECAPSSELKRNRSPKTLLKASFHSQAIRVLQSINVFRELVTSKSLNSIQNVFKIFQKIFVKFSLNLNHLNRVK